MTNTNITLQLYTVREATARDMLGTLRRVAEIGYPAVELAGYGNSTATDIRQTLDEVGMRAIASHVSIADAQNRLDSVIADLKTLGCEHAVIPFIGEEWRHADNVKQLGQILNGLGARLQDEGIRLSYHNHAFEFEPTNGTTLFDTLVDSTDPSLVNLEVDLGWVEYAGVDAASVVRRLPGRVPLVHVKDMTAGAERVDAPFGEGAIDWDPIFVACREAGVEWYIVEQDRPQNPIANVETSLRNLTRKLGES
ncbi:MAG: sugar phosphate isomerase/epimerase family protein [Thermomicrobiales bacterium]